MPLITVSQGGPDIEPGVYSVTLAKLEGPKIIYPQSGPNAGQEVEIFDWTFQVDEGDYTGTDIQATTSTASGPRSKMYSWITALMSGKAPLVGATFEAEDLCGLRAIATIGKSETGWPRIENLGAFPVTQPRGTAPRPVAPAAAVPRPLAPTRAPIRQQVAADPNANLPF